MKSFPDDLKVAKITPIFKDGSMFMTDNYRPVAGLPILSKVYERVILNRIYDHMKKKILNEAQFGFVNFSNTETAVAHLLNTICTSLEIKKHTASLFIDFKKAFDTVNHKILIINSKK